MAANEPQQPPSEPRTHVDQAPSKTVAASQAKPEPRQPEKPSDESSKAKVVTLVLSSSLLCALVGGFFGNRLEHSKATIELKKEDRKAQLSQYVTLEERVQRFENQLTTVIAVLTLLPAVPADRKPEKFLEDAFDSLGKVMSEIKLMLNDRRIDASIRTQIQSVLDESTPMIFEAQETHAGVALEQLYEGKLKQSFQDLQFKIEQEQSNLLSEPL